MIRVTVWNENVHERKNELVGKLYPDGIHGAIAAGLKKLDSAGELAVRTATLEQPEHGLTEDVLRDTDVLTWWGHRAHGEVDDAIVDRVQQRVLEGMGLLVLHSGHFSKIFKRLMGTPCALKWREAGERERLWVVNPGHPIAEGIGPCIELENTEMYGEPFSIPEPEEQVFISWFEGGEVFRSGNCWHRGNGRIFYFRPGHETYPIYYNEQVLKVIFNGIKWAAPRGWWPGIGRADNVPADQAPERIEVKGGSVH
jgi:trehalose utilization protein